MILLAAAKSSNGGSAIQSLITFALIGAVMYMLVIRPQRNRAKGVAAAQSALEPGREVILTSGIYGTVLHVDKDKVGLEVAPGVTVQVARAAVARVVQPLPDSADSADPGAALS